MIHDGLIITQSWACVCHSAGQWSRCSTSRQERPAKKTRLFHQRVCFSSFRNFKHWTIQPYIYLSFQSFQAFSIHTAAAHLHNHTHTHTLFPPETSASSSGSEQPLGSHTKSLRVKCNGWILKQRRISATGSELCYKNKIFHFFVTSLWKKKLFILTISGTSNSWILTVHAEVG